MTWKMLKLFAFALFAVLPLAAQDNCPREKAVPVGGSIQFGPSVSCSGLSWSAGGLSLSTASGCPLFVVITPAHETAAPTDKLTKVKVAGTDPIKVFIFVCRTRYLIFIPIGSTCEFASESNAGSVMRLVTVGCTDDEG